MQFQEGIDSGIAENFDPKKNLSNLEGLPRRPMAEFK